jgi:hypothetical protein
MHILVEDALNFKRHRERTLFAGERDLTAVDGTITRYRVHDISRVALYVNGGF